MSDEIIVQAALRAKADALANRVSQLETDLDQARADLASVMATLNLFSPPPAGTRHPMHYSLERLFKTREISQLCVAALQDGHLSTRQLAERLIQVKGLDPTDHNLRAAIVYRVVQAMRMKEVRGRTVKRVGLIGKAIVWALVR